MRFRFLQRYRRFAQMLQYPCCALFLALAYPVTAQQIPAVQSEVDTTAIKIGEQIRFTVRVETDTSAQVIFPEGQTFSPLETVEAFKTDTTRREDRMTLQKIYALTQFDSGYYKLPTQRIEINGKGFFTDSVMIAVATVPVDTVNQKMYDIKPLIAVDKSNTELWKLVLIILLIASLVGGLLYWFLWRKKPLSDAEKEAMLPAYDRALLELKRLENSRYLIQDEYKKYYSELTDIVRSYLEEDVHVSALESTTNQLIDKLEAMKDAGELRLEESTILQFKKILETADLVKFARSKPATSVAEQDRKAVEEIVIKTKEALPEPSEEELMEKQEYLEAQKRQKQKKKVLLLASALGGLLLFISATAIAFYGFNYVKDTVLGHPTKELLEGEWVYSNYGYPPIGLETPEVLLRQKIKLNPEAKADIKEIHEFMYRSPRAWFTVLASSLTLNQAVEPNYDEAVEQLLKRFEDEGAKNIITKQETFTTLAGVTGIKVYGSGTFVLPDSNDLVKGQYAILLFGGNGFQQRILISWQEDDAYAKKMVDRILKSVDVKTEV